MYCVMGRHVYSSWLDNPLCCFALDNDGQAEAAVWALHHELLVAASLEEVGHALDEDEPADNHEHVRHPLAAGKVDAATTGARDVAGLKVVRVGVLGLGVAVGSVHGGGFAVNGALHVEAVLDERDAEAGAGTVLGRVRRVQEICQEETDELKGRRNHAVPNEGEDGAHRHAVHVYFVEAP